MILYIAQDIDTVMAKHAAQLHYYFNMKYPQQTVLTSRFGDVWRNLFDLATLVRRDLCEQLTRCYAATSVGRMQYNFLKWNIIAKFVIMKVSKSLKFMMEQMKLC